MALRPELQPLCCQIIYKNLVPSLDSAISDLVAEDTRLHSLSTLASTLTSESETVLAVTSWSSSGGPCSNTTTRLLYHLQEHWPYWLFLPPFQILQSLQEDGPHWARVFQSSSRVTSSGTSAEEATWTFSPSYFFSRTSRHVSWYNSTFTSWSYRYPTSTYSDWVTASASVNIRRIFGLGLLCCLRYVFLDFRFQCLIHMTSDSIILFAITPLSSHFSPLHIADGSQLTITQTRSITSLTLTLLIVLHVPHLCTNLISISSLCEFSLIVTFDYFTCSVQGPQSGQMIGRAHRREKMYHLDFLLVPVSSNSSQSLAGVVSSAADL